MPGVVPEHTKRPPIQKDEGDFELKKICVAVKRFLAKTDGFETVEYGIMTSMIIIAIVAALVLMTVTITNTFANAATLVN